MADTNDQNSPMPKRKRCDSSPKPQQQHQQYNSDENVQSNSQDSIQIKSEFQYDSLQITDVDNAMVPLPPMSPPPSSQTTTELLKIDVLDEKILVKIFQWLDFPDLLHVANATKKLRNAAGQIYNQKYAQKVVKFNVATIGSNIEQTPTTFEINDARTCLLMFRGFGDSIEKLHLNFNGLGKRRIQAISQALNDYCAKSLNKLDVYILPANAITEKFPKLTNLRVNGGVLSAKMTQFNEMFPSLSVLDLSNIQVENRKSIERTFPKLVHLKVHIEMQKGMDFMKSNVKTAIQMNPQLRSLCLGSGCDSKLLPFINRMLPLLSRLEIQEPRNKLFDSDIEPVQFERVRQFTLDIPQCKDSYSNIPFEFDRLEKFHLNVSKPNRDKWINFIEKQKRLIELHLLNFDWFYVVSKVQLAKIATLPKLIRLVLDWHVNDPAAFVQLINNCSTLQMVRLTTRTQDERAAICSKLNTGWYMHIDGNILTLQRTNE